MKVRWLGHSCIEVVGQHHVIPIHHDIPPWEADPAELEGHVEAEVIVPTEWVELP